MNAWLRFFRAVNIPTVPGDVLVGAAAAFCGVETGGGFHAVAFAALASVFIYLFGLADNDIVGAKSDTGRPIPDGEITIGAARIARGLCIFGALIIGSAANLPPAWWIVALLLTVAVVAYNRVKWPVLMGLCRALNVLCGAAVMPRMMVDFASFFIDSIPVWIVTLLWLVYIAAVTRFSEGEELNPSKKATVGFLIGALVYLQLGALVVFFTMNIATRPLLLTGAVLLIALRVMKYSMPKVSAS